jgi:integrase
MYKTKLILSKVHEKVHGLKTKKNWSTPKIYHGGNSFDLSKDWYVYFSFRNPSTNLLVRQGNIKRGNRFKSKLKRLEILHVYQKALIELLDEGFSPYDVQEKDQPQHTIEYALDFAMTNKKETYAVNNYKVMIARVGVFKEFLKKKRLLQRPPEMITKQVINDFLDETLHNSSAANRNNYKSGLSALFTFLVLRDIVQENYFLKIPKLKTKPKGKKTYSKVLQQSVLDWMRTNDPLLLQFIQIFTFGMIRPVEAVRLQVKDINIQERFFYVNSKQKSEKKKIISQLLFDVLPDLSTADPNDFLITKDGVGSWNRSDNGRRNFFTQRFLTMRDVLQFDSDLKMYNFRHTIISELYVKLIAEHGKNKAIELLLEITGHSTEKALMHYLETMDASLPADFSKYFD